MLKNFIAIVLLLTASSVAADTLTQEDINCLRMNTYHEARGESYDGQVAVVHVVLNRVKSSRYPNSVCQVVQQGRHDSAGNPIRHKCQFSWYCDGRSDKARDIVAWNNVGISVQEAVFLFNKGIDLTRGSMYYHTTSVNPLWARRFKRVDQIGVHVFYIRG